MKSKLIWVTFIPLALIACGCKLAQSLVPEGAVPWLTPLRFDYLYMAAVGLIFVLSLLFIMTDKKMAAYYLPRRDLPAGIIGLLLALLFAADGALTLIRLFGAGTIDVLNTLSGVFSLLSAVVVVVLSLNYILHSEDGKHFSLFNVMPALLCAVRMILCFVSFTTISIRLADVSRLICYIFATLFFFYYAVTLSLIKSKNALKFCVAFGFPAVAALVPYGVYHLAFHFDGEVILNNIQPLEMLLIGLYILAVLIEMSLFVGDKDSVVIVVEEESAEPVAEDNVEGFVTGGNEDETAADDDSAYYRSTDTEDFLYRETAPVEESAEVSEAVLEEADSYLTEVVEEPADEEDGRPKDYESRLDEIDKLILEITGKSD